MKMTRLALDKVIRWFGHGVRDVVEGNVHAISPSSPDIQGDPGPRPYTDWAYEQGRIIGEKILADEKPNVPT